MDVVVVVKVAPPTVRGKKHIPSLYSTTHISEGKCKAFGIPLVRLEECVELGRHLAGERGAGVVLRAGRDHQVAWGDSRGDVLVGEVSEEVRLGTNYSTTR